MQARRMKKALAAACVGVAAALSLASAPALADAASVKSELLKKFPKLNPQTPVVATAIPGVYEVNLSGKAAYTDEKVSFFITNGHLVDPKSLRDLTEERSMAVIHQGFEMLPLDIALKTVYGNGKRTLVVFEDPDCPFCREEHSKVFETQAGLLNATVYTFLLPITSLHPDAERHSLAILCAPDPNAAWRKWMSTVNPVAANLPPPSTCDAGTKRLAKMAAEGQNRGFNGTPTMMFASGQVSTLGELNIDQLNKGFDFSDQFMAQLNAQKAQSQLDKALPAPAAPPAAKK
jgi:thiol:disulfide interchange protein DsbC